VVLILYAAVAAGLYAPALTAFFVSDDYYEFIQHDFPSGPWYRIESFTRTGYRIRILTPAVVLFTSGGRLEDAGTVR